MSTEPPGSDTLGIEIARFLASTFPRGSKRRVLRPPFHVLVVHTEDGRLLAIEDACPHSSWSLELGCVRGATVVCPGHGWVVSLEDGRVLSPSFACAERNPVFRVAVEGEWIVVRDPS